jgi:OmpA-OmpF porin, OOP family
MEASIKGRAWIMVIMLFIFVAIGVYSCVVQAQSFSMNEAQPMYTKNAGKRIKLAEGINESAVAVAVNSAINSPFEELKPALTPCGNRLYFSRHFHPENTNGTADAEDIWYADYDESTGAWSEPVRMAGDLNNAGPNFINNVSVTGDTIILGNKYGRKGKMRAGLSYSVNIHGRWSAPVSIDVAEDYNMAQHANAFVSLKHGIIITAIQRVETVGARDLYVSFWDGTTATPPVNMGSIINSEFDESSPFLASDNKTLYFASKGHNGYGGYDIYVTQRLDDTWTNWSEPRNLGPAVNSSLDDEFFSVTHCGTFAIFSRQISVHNVDLYRIALRDLYAKPLPYKREAVDSNTAVASL